MTQSAKRAHEARDVRQAEEARVQQDRLKFHRATRNEELATLLRTKTPIGPPSLPRSKKKHRLPSFLRKGSGSGSNCGGGRRVSSIIARRTLSRSSQTHQQDKDKVEAPFLQFQGTSHTVLFNNLTNTDLFRIDFNLPASDDPVAAHIPGSPAPFNTDEPLAGPSSPLSSSLSPSESTTSPPPITTRESGSSTQRDDSNRFATALNSATGAGERMTDELMTKSPQPRRSTRVRRPRKKTEVISLVERRRLEEQAQRNVIYEDNMPEAEEEVLQEMIGDAPDNPGDGTSEEPIDDSRDDASESSPSLALPGVPPLPELGGDFSEAYDTLSDHWFIRVILAALVSFHDSYGLPFRAIAKFLVLLRIVFNGLGLLCIDDNMPLTLDTTLARLNLNKDRFTTFIVCGKCHRLFTINIPVSSSCPDCSTALFKTVSQNIFQRLYSRSPPPPQPLFVAPLQPLSSLLQDFLNQPGIEDAIDSYWKTRYREEGIRTDIMDGEIWKNVKGPDGRPFFDPHDDSGDLRIGVTFSLDWQVLSLFLISYLTDYIFH